MSGSGKRNNLPGKRGSRSRGKKRRLSALHIPDRGWLIAQLKPVAAWARLFDDPVLLPGGRELLTPPDAADYITKKRDYENSLDLRRYNKEVGDVDHLKVFATPELADRWF